MEARQTALPHDAAALAVDRAHEEIWRRFVHRPDDHDCGIVLDYADLDGSVPLPTPEESRLGKPNALAWWSPPENGAFFNGLYLDGLLNRWQSTGDEQARLRARQIARGLIRLAEVGNTPGFIARGICADGAGHHLIGSDDQTIPWFYGMWKYVNSGLCDEEERGRIVKLYAATAEAIRAGGWRMPCDREGYAYRGTFEEPSFRDAARLLFMLKSTAVLTGDAKWQELYVAAGEEKADGSAKTRFEWCAGGIVDEPGSYYESDLLTPAVCASGVHPPAPDRRWPYWITASSQAALRELMLLEDDPQRKAMFRSGLAANARRAFAYIANEAYVAYDNDNTIPFDPDWRFLNEWWEPQESVADALRVAGVQIREWNKRSPRKLYEGQYMREPLFAAWFVTLAGDPALVAEARDAIRRLLTQYEWSGLYYSLFFIAECVYFEGLRLGL
ncbi:MAG: hypothetical protein J7639_13670 [Paenibacillaceae bacterium]|nr:hypothetical protein [Paenibacillaceae bacterium]